MGKMTNAELQAVVDKQAAQIQQQAELLKSKEAELDDLDKENSKLFDMNNDLISKKGDGRDDATTFLRAAAVDVSTYIEKKGKFSYLSWPWAVKELKKMYPQAHWIVTNFTKADGSTVPYMKDDKGFAYVSVGVQLRPNEQHQYHTHPVLDNNNKPVLHPDGFKVNTSIMRCLVKAIAITTGLGLSIYAGEDLPDAFLGDDAPPTPPPMDDPISKQTADTAIASISMCETVEQLKACWDQFNKAVKAGQVTAEHAKAVSVVKDEKKAKLHG